MSRQIKSEEEFQELIKDARGVFVMVYPSWCHYSLDFLPVFENFATDKTRSCARVIVDDLRGIDNRYDINVYPTVLYFKDGKLAKRLDGVSGVGLDERKLKDFVSRCG